MIAWLVWIAAAYGVCGLACGMWVCALERRVKAPDAFVFGLQAGAVWPLVIVARLYVWWRSRSGDIWWWMRG